MNPVSDTVLERLERLHESIVRVIRGKAEIVDALIAALLARGHVLLEDVPGVGKTTLAQAVARSLDLEFNRIQFTSDTLPSDIIGISVFRQDRGEFEFMPGPLFASVVLADEINRAAPRTQSALLEAMSEHAVTVDKTRHRLVEPFFVVATQNPIESTGTYPLPESQLDRFLMRLSMGYPGGEEELELLRSSGVEPELARLTPVLDAAEVIEMQNLVPEVHVAETLRAYLLQVVAATRSHEALALGVSTRGCLAWQRSAQALALVRGRSYVLPDDLQDTAESVLSHRLLHADPLVGDGWQRSRAERAVIRAILDGIPVPR
ncbi:MAG: MoxR family ATPase [Thermoanaerobaculales bacterium]|jgi:MoxR-like ATPase|nr:MoxR family ATPase [Thermoanaerobaculales bacterium]